MRRLIYDVAMASTDLLENEINPMDGKTLGFKSRK